MLHTAGGGGNQTGSTGIGVQGSGGNSVSGGAGGDGYWGGAAGHMGAAGGGGGSGFGPADVAFTTRYRTGNGQVMTSYTLPSVSDQAAQLVADSTGVGPGHALADKASAIQSAVNAGQTATACADITNYLGLVKAKTGKTLTSSQAAQLTAEADNLAAALCRVNGRRLSLVSEN